MVDKKHWITELKEEPQESVYISWSSSDSESEIDLSFIKKNSKNLKNSSISWARPLPTENSYKSVYNSPEHSPIVSSLSVNDMSPILTQKETFQSLESSPVLGKRCILKEIRHKFKTKQQVEEISEKFECSPDMFESQYIQIIESQSPKSVTADCNTSVESELIIHSFPSQHSSKIVQTDCVTSNNSSATLYHQPVSRKRNYKKRGLASQLQKTIILQKNRLSIWKHELFMKRCLDMIDLIEFEVLKVQKDFGIILLECKEMYKNNVGENSNIIILVKHCDIQFKERTKYKLYPPYDLKIVTHKSEESICYFNVTRIVLYNINAILDEEIK